MFKVTTNSLPSPKELKEKLPIGIDRAKKLFNLKSQIKKIFKEKSNKLAIILGPCSIHDNISFMHYAELFQKLSAKVDKNILLILRVFSEKSRTALGWKGFLYDPDLDSSYNIEKGLFDTRKILLRLASYNIPCAMEFVEPLVIPYFDDLISWGFIGARTSSSQPHRLISSALDIPVGFKNATDGCVDVAINGMLTASVAHSFIGLSQAGVVSKVLSKGNPYTHLVLRGANNHTNFHLNDITTAQSKISQKNLKPKIIIDCSHGNSAKNIEKQKSVFLDVFSTYQKNPNSIIGMMLESFIFEGSQLFQKSPNYGISVTDPCLDFKTTTELIYKINEMIENTQMSVI